MRARCRSSRAGEPSMARIVSKSPSPWVSPRSVGLMGRKSASCHSFSRQYRVIDSDVG